MRVTKKIKSDLEIIDNLQKITGYKLTKKSKEKSPRMILLQKVSNNEYNNPIKVQLLKTKNNNQNQYSNLLNMNITSLSLNNQKVSFIKKDVNYHQNKTKEDLDIKNKDITKLKASLITSNKNRILDSPKLNNRYKNLTNKNINQSPSQKSSNLDNNSNLKSHHQILNILSKNFAYNKKKANNQILSPALGVSSVFQPSRKNTNNTNNKNPKNKKMNNSNNEYGTKTYIGRENYSVNSFKNYNMNINSPKTPSYITDIDSKSVKNNISNYIIDIKLEDLILFEERLIDIIIAINQGNNNNKYDIGASNECYEFFAFYFHSSLKYKFPLIFHEENRLIIQSAINLKLFIIMITYHLSLNPNLLIKLLDDLKFIYSSLKQNLYLFIKKLIIFYGEAFVLQNEMYFKNFNCILSEKGLNNLTETEIKDLIFKNCTNIAKNVSNILNLYKIIEDPFYTDFNEMFNILSQITEKEINNYFCSYLSGENKQPKIFYKTENNIPNYIFNNKINSDVELYEYKKNRFRPPYIATPSQKKYSLVLDLNNTLISYDENSESNTTYILRPGLLSFLNTIKPIYELISFTNESKEISDKYLEEIEANKKYFDFNLYKEHNILIGRNLVKDISKIGRDMKKIIIVDKIYENIKATPQNGILIKPYFGEKDKNDTVLFELKKLLILIHKMGYEDIRTAIKNYSNDIKYKITCDNFAK